MGTNRNLLIAGSALMLVSASFVWFELHRKREPQITERERGEALFSIHQLPHGRVLYVVVEDDGVYVGQRFVPFILLDAFLKKEARALVPDYAIVIGTDAAVYGKVVEVYASVKNALSLPQEMQTLLAPTGTRRGPIEVHKNSWEYEPI